MPFSGSSINSGFLIFLFNNFKGKVVLGINKGLNVSLLQCSVVKCRRNSLLIKFIFIGD